MAPGAHDWGPRVDAGSGTAAELVYHLAGALGTELKELARRFGPEAAAGLVPLVVRALELLEKAAVGPAPDSVSHGQLPSPPEGSAGPDPESLASPSCRYRRSRPNWSCGGCGRRTSASVESCALGHRVSTDAPGSGHGGAAPLRATPKNAPSSEERALLRQLKEVTDRQRDELRAHNRDLLQRSQETEAVRAGRGRLREAGLSQPRRPAHQPPPLLRPQLQEQLQRLLLVNAELRHKLAAVQTQLRAARDRESERELHREAAVGPPPERARGQAGGPVGEQGQEPERGAPDAGTQGTPENPVSAIGGQGLVGARERFAVLRSRATGKLEGGTSQSTGLASLGVPWPLKSPSGSRGAHQLQPRRPHTCLSADGRPAAARAPPQGGAVQLQSSGG